MKLFLSCNKLHLFFVILWFFLNINLLNAEENIDKNIKEITIKLRCMTCQNQTIYDSDADFSKDIKKIIREKLINGQSQKEIIDFLVKRYGEYILLEPQFNKKNIFLWIFPFLVLFLSTIVLLMRIKKTNIGK